MHEIDTQSYFGESVRGFFRAKINTINAEQQVPSEVLSDFIRFILSFSVVFVLMDQIAIDTSNDQLTLLNNLGNLLFASEYFQPLCYSIFLACQYMFAKNSLLRYLETFIRAKLGYLCITPQQEILLLQELLLIQDQYLMILYYLTENDDVYERAKSVVLIINANIPKLKQIIDAISENINDEQRNNHSHTLILAAVTSLFVSYESYHSMLWTLFFKRGLKFEVGKENSNTIINFKLNNTAVAISIAASYESSATFAEVDAIFTMLGDTIKSLHNNHYKDSLLVELVNILMRTIDNSPVSQSMQQFMVAIRNDGKPLNRKISLVHALEMLKLLEKDTTTSPMHSDSFVRPVVDSPATNYEPLPTELNPTDTNTLDTSKQPDIAVNIRTLP